MVAALVGRNGAPLLLCSFVSLQSLLFYIHYEMSVVCNCVSKLLFAS